MVEELLRKGRKNARSHTELCLILNTTNRELQKKIAEERENGAVILSTSEKGGGYFLPETREEIVSFINTLSNRAGNTFKALKSAKALLKKIDASGVSL